MQSESADRGFEGAVKSPGKTVVPSGGKNMDSVHREDADRASVQAESADRGFESRPMFSLLAEESRPRSAKKSKPPKVSSLPGGDSELTDHGIYCIFT